MKNELFRGVEWVREHKRDVAVYLVMTLVLVAAINNPTPEKGIDTIPPPTPTRTPIATPRVNTIRELYTREADEGRPPRYVPIR